MLQKWIIYTMIALLGFATQPAIACILLDSHTSTLLDELPAGAYEQQVIAKIEIIEIILNPYRRSSSSERADRVKARVTKAIKGVDENQVITISACWSDCDRCFSPRDIGVQAYIAGRLVEPPLDVQIFEGTWRLDLKGRIR